MSLSRIILYFCTTGKSITFTNLLLYLKILLSHFDSLVSIHVLERNLFLSPLTRRRRFCLDPTPGCSLQRVTKTLLILLRNCMVKRSPWPSPSEWTEPFLRLWEIQLAADLPFRQKVGSKYYLTLHLKKITDLWNILTSLCLYDLQEILSSEKARSRLPWIVSAQMCIKLWI